jgi:hypothetical protein
MKKIFLVSILVLIAFEQNMAQSYYVERLILDIEKLAQLKGILSDMYSGYATLSQGYDEVRNLSEANFNLHSNYLNGLLQVNPAVQNSPTVSAIIQNEGEMVTAWQSAYQRFSADPHFSTAEISYINTVYVNLMSGCQDNLNNLTTILTAGDLRMSDAERLRAIGEIYSDAREKLEFLKVFNSTTTILAVQRAKELNDVGTIRNLYGMNP